MSIFDCSQIATEIALLITLTAYHLFLDSYFDATLTTGMARARHWYFIRNQFEQQWFDVISFHKTRRVYPAIRYSLKPFAKRKGRFKLSTPAKCTLSKDKALIKKVLKFKTFYVQEIRLQNNVASVFSSYLSLVFPYIGDVKYPHGRTAGTNQQQNNSKNPNGKDCVTFHRTTAYHCCHSSHDFTGSREKSLFLTYDSWSALPWKYEPGQNRIGTFLKTLVVFSGFSLFSLERSSLAVFAGVQDVVYPGCQRLF